MYRRRKTFWRKAGDRLDGLVAAISPKMAYNRQKYRYAYDVLDGGRLRKKRSLRRQGGDQDLTERNLDRLREIARDLSTNNPLVKGIFRKLTTNIVGTQTRIQARTSDEGWNNAAEAAFKEEMIDKSCDVTGRFNFHGLLNKSYYRYAQDGDCFIILTDNGPQAVQGEFCGTPYGKTSAVLQPKNFEITNGVAISKATGRIIGYYIGKPNKWGYIKPESYKKYSVENIIHIVNYERFDHSRGEPMLTSAVPYIDYLMGYWEAELVAAKVNACFPMTSLTYDSKSMAGPLGSIKTFGGTDKKDDYDRPLARMEPGQIWEGEPGEKLEALGSARPSQAFDPFVMRTEALIGSSVCLPLMLVSGDFSHATFMNSRFAYGEFRSFAIDEQEFVLRRPASGMWLWKMKDLIDRKELTKREDWNAHQIYFKRWPYVDPSRERLADKIALESADTNHTIIAAREGIDWKEDIWDQRVKEEEMIKKSGIVLSPKQAAGTNAK